MLLYERSKIFVLWQAGCGLNDRLISIVLTLPSRSYLQIVALFGDRQFGGERKFL